MNNINNPGINNPGIRERPDGAVTLQFKKRSSQVEVIAEEFRNAFTDGILPNQTRKMLKYCDQLLIIASEMKGCGK